MDNPMLTRLQEAGIDKGLWFYTLNDSFSIEEDKELIHANFFYGHPQKDAGSYVVNSDDDYKSITVDSSKKGLLLEAIEYLKIIKLPD